YHVESCSAGLRHLRLDQKEDSFRFCGWGARYFQIVLAEGQLRLRATTIKPKNCDSLLRPRMPVVDHFFQQMAVTGWRGGCVNWCQIRSGFIILDDERKFSTMLDPAQENTSDTCSPSSDEVALQKIH